MSLALRHRLTCDSRGSPQASLSAATGAMSSATAASASATAAVERQLKSWGLDVSATNVALYATLKANHSRVSAAMMKKQGMSVQTVFSQGSTVNTS